MFTITIWTTEHEIIELEDGQTDEQEHSSWEDEEEFETAEDIAYHLKINGLIEPSSWAGDEWPGRNMWYNAEDSIDYLTGRCVHTSAHFGDDVDDATRERVWKLLNLV